MSASSMTGFGRADAPLAGRRLVVEIRSVNHRFLELKLRLGRDDAELEAELTRLCRARMERGAVSLSLREELDEGEGRSGNPAELIDTERAIAWTRALAQLGAAIGSPGAPSLQLVCAQPGVLRQRAAETPRAELAVAAKAATTVALDALVAARAREGVALVAELNERLASLVKLRVEVMRLAATEPALHAEKLTARVMRLLDEHAESRASDARWREAREALPSEAKDVQRERPPLTDRLAQEIALLAERLDVTEELVRLGAHLDEARRLLDGKGPSGRRLDFLSQEIHREVNTIGSKSQSTEIVARIVDMKAELERFREQVQNVE